MAKALALAAGLAAACLAGCSPFGGAQEFTCDGDNSKCRAGGTCQPNGYCSRADSECASGQRYEEHSGTNSNVCVGEEPKPTEAGIDTPMGPVCFGAQTGLVKPCFMTEPMGEMVLPATINTDTSQLCKPPMSGGDGYCVIAFAQIRVENTVAVTGGKPLVLVAADKIIVSGTLDAASKRGANGPDFTPVQIGAGADPATGCSFGNNPGNNGGGVGGTLGGSGGLGGNNGGTPPAALPTITALRGGCRGQNGNSGTPGAGGHGGGAVYLIAKNTIEITGAINASGEAGHPGVTGNAGGGGGGSGGLIGLDAMTITNTGVVFANGGSGGEGSGNQTQGNPGNEANSAAPAPAPLSTSNGGGGGAGGAGGTAGGNLNANPGQNAAGFGGGGGGGGAGLLKVYRGALTGEYSPQPST